MVFRFTRPEMEARYQLFERFAMDDQRNYYRSAVSKSRLAADQVNKIAAIFAFVTGLSAAAAGLLVQLYFTSNGQCNIEPIPDGINCDAVQGLVLVFIGLSIVMPAMGAFFTTVADLYQWDRGITIYEGALEHIEVADAQSPRPEMDDEVYWASLRAFAEGTLQVMRDETTQWGQSIRTPPQLEKFIEEERKITESIQTPKLPS